ncbi:MAG: hypothetical protein RIE86_14475 [Imperialibacter sp.]|uniref:hypothetical protein n=1 Tax=Imperialibacter sp. TaxID=2038411 RepID=UPI0032EE512F
MKETVDMREETLGILELLRPVAPADLIRVGRSYDGGYVFSSQSLASCSHFISCGLSYDWSFEIELKERRPDLPIVAFDRTSGFNSTMLYWVLKNFGKIALYPFRFLGVQDTPAQSWGKISMMLRMKQIFSGNLQFVKKHIGLESNSGVQSFGELFEHNNGYGVKLDVEGTEYELLDTIIGKLDKIELLLIEFHNVEENIDAIVPFLKAIRATHYVQHVHGNNYDSVNSFGFLNSIELTIAKKDSGYQPESAEVLTYPVKDLDFPNDRRKPDVGFDFKEQGQK